MALRVARGAAQFGVKKKKRKKESKKEKQRKRLHPTNSTWVAFHSVFLLRSREAYTWRITLSPCGSDLSSLSSKRSSPLDPFFPLHVGAVRHKPQLLSSLGAKLKVAAVTGQDRAMRRARLGIIITCVSHTAINRSVSCLGAGGLRDWGHFFFFCKCQCGVFALVQVARCFLLVIGRKCHTGSFCWSQVGGPVEMDAVLCWFFAPFVHKSVSSSTFI